MNLNNGPKWWNSFQALDTKTTSLSQKQISVLALRLIFHRFSLFNCCFKVPFCSLIKGIAPKIRNPNKQRVFSFFLIFLTFYLCGWKWWTFGSVWVVASTMTPSRTELIKKKYHERGEYSESIITARSAGALVFSNQLTIKGNTSEQRINRRL